MELWVSTALAMSLLGGDTPPASVLATQEALLEPTTASQSLAGVSIAIDGDRALVGAPGAAGGGAPGIVYAYQRIAGNWALAQTIPNPGGAERDNFGASVAISGDHAVIGAPFAGSSEEGTAYHYVHDGTTWSGTAIAPAPSAPTRFGTSVAISAEWIVVGAPDSGAAVPGVAFVYAVAGGPPVALVAPDAEAEDRFGASVAVSGVAVLVGAPDDDNARAVDAGSVYPFDLVTGIAGDALLPDANGPVRFGTSVALSADGTRALVGAPDEAVASMSAAGAAYAFERSVGGPWPLTGTRLVASDGRASDRFGTSVALSGSDAAIGAPFHEEAVLESGAAYLFSLRAEWVEVARYVRDGAEAEDGLGWSVAVSGRTLLAGAPQRNTTTRVGFAASFVFPEPTGAACTRDDRCESGACEMSVCCEGCEGGCQRCTATGMCEALPDSTACTSSCGGGTCQAGVCSAACPDTGAAIDGSVPPRTHVSGCKCGAYGSHGGVHGITFLAIAAALRIARRTRGRARRTARTRAP